MTKWEYKFVVLDFNLEPGNEQPLIDLNETDLNRMGADGWEVVSVVSEGNSTHPQSIALMKRMKKDPTMKIAREDEKPIPGL